MRRERCVHELLCWRARSGRRLHHGLTTYGALCDAIDMAVDHETAALGALLAQARSLLGREADGFEQKYRRLWDEAPNREEVLQVLATQVHELRAARADCSDVDDDQSAS